MILILHSPDLSPHLFNPPPILTLELLSHMSRILLLQLDLLDPVLQVAQSLVDHSLMVQNPHLELLLERAHGLLVHLIHVGQLALELKLNLLLLLDLEVQLRLQLQDLPQFHLLVSLVGFGLRVLGKGVTGPLGAEISGQRHVLVLGQLADEGDGASFVGRGLVLELVAVVAKGFLARVGAQDGGRFLEAEVALLKVQAGVRGGVRQADGGLGGFPGKDGGLRMHINE